jgi:hypothetical protein
MLRSEVFALFAAVLCVLCVKAFDPQRARRIRKQRKALTGIRKAVILLVWNEDELLSGLPEKIGVKCLSRKHFLQMYGTKANILFVNLSLLPCANCYSESKSGKKSGLGS